VIAQRARLRRFDAADPLLVDESADVVLGNVGKW
jgi:hypothetical protein